MPFALKNPYASTAAKGEKRAGDSLEDPSTPKKAKKAPSAASLVGHCFSFCLRNCRVGANSGDDGEHQQTKSSAAVTGDRAFERCYLQSYGQGRRRLEQF